MKMYLISKAEEIAKLNEQLKQNTIGKKEYNERLSAILYSSYRPFETGVTVSMEKQLLWNLVVDDVITQRDYDEQVSKMKRAVAYCAEERRQVPPPPLRRKKGYVAPIVWLVIGWCCCHWFLPLGILILILALIGLSCRVSHNKSVEVDNAGIMMRYGAKYPY
jgi:hypothetical protein